MYHKIYKRRIARKINALHKNLQFTLEYVDANGELAFLDMNKCVGKESKDSCRWYHKPTDSSTILNFRIRVQLLHKRNTVQGTVDRRFICTSNWKNFEEAIKTTQDIWSKNLYPENRTAKNVNEALETLLVGKQKA